MLRIALGLSIFLLFLAVITAATAHQVLGLVSGGRTVAFWSMLVAAAGFALAWRESAVSGAPSARLRAAPDAWARAGMLLLFLVYLNAFVYGLFTRDTWGLVTGHDQPQYFMQLHSFLFDFDVDYANEYALMPDIKERMAAWQPDDPLHNVAPIGAAILWMPFYILAHLCVLVLQHVNSDFVANGVSAPYAMAAAFGSNALVFGGMLLLYQSLRRWCSPMTSFVTVATLYLATNLTWYLTGEAWMSHAASFAAACLVLYVYIRFRHPHTLAQWALYGAVIGIAMLVRPSHFVLLIIPAAEAVLLWRVQRAPVPIGRGLVMMVAVMLLVFSPQLLVWSIRGTEGSPMAWGSPALLAILFSSQSGLIAWHPVTALGVVGLVLLWRHSRGMTVTLAALLIAYWYTNAAIGAWSAGASFGMRRFVGTLPFLAPGIALAGSWIVHFIQRRPWTVAAVGLLVLGVYNHFLLIQHRALWFDPGAAVSFRTVWATAGGLYQDYYGHPFSYPANLLFAARYDASATQYDLLGTRLNDGKPLDLRGQLLRAHLGRGWERHNREDYKEDSAFSAAEKDCAILLPLKADHAYRVELELAVPKELERPQRAAFVLNGEQLAEVTLTDAGWNQIPLVLPGQLTRDGINMLELRFSETKVREMPEGSFYIGGGIEMTTIPPWRSSAILRRVTLTPVPGG
jgi:hypothetical protein